MPTPKGVRYGGRQKGTPNKSTQAVKEALSAAYRGLGGEKALIAWAKAEPTEFYKLWAKMLPTEVKADVTNRTALIADRPVTEDEWASEVSQLH